MYLPYLNLLLAALVPLAASAPTADLTPIEARAQGGFSISQEDTGRKRFRNGPIAVERAMRKFGGNITNGLATAAAQARGSVAANPEQFDSEYLSPVKLGAQTLMLDIDSGSSDLWVFSSQQAASDRGQHAFYQTSPSKRLQGQTWRISYGDNSMAEGIVFADRVVVGGVTATRQAVEAATSVSTEFVQDKNNDGIFGFGFSSINQVRPNKQKTWFDNVKATLPAPIWAANLKRKAPGSYDFGYTDNTKYQGSIQYRPVFPVNGFWQFLCAGYFVGNRKYSNGPETFEAIVDTGTSLMLLQSRDVDNYYANVPSAQFIEEAGGYVFPCNTNLPDFSLIVNGQRRRVPGAYINYAPLGVQNLCFGGIQSAGNVPFAILGDVFIKAQYIVFDAGAPRIGFAQQKGIPATV